MIEISVIFGYPKKIQANRTGFVRVRESQGNLEIWKIISRSMNYQGILKIQEKVGES